MKKLALILPWQLFLIIFGFSLYGWIMNIITLWTMPLDPLTGQLIIRIIGIFVAPLGAILGFV
jgi:hypothetical protein